MRHFVPEVSRCRCRKLLICRSEFGSLNSIVKRICFAAIAGLITGCPGCYRDPASNRPIDGGSTRPNSHGRGFAIVGYLPDYRVDGIAPEVGRHLTDLIYFSIEPNADGSINSDRFSSTARERLHVFRTFGVRIHVCIGGWDRSDHFGPVATRPEVRQRFVDNVLQFCADNRFDGVDIDWEFPDNDAERRAWCELLADLKAGLAKQGLMLSVAVASMQEFPAGIPAQVDRIHLMAYNAQGRHATLEHARQTVHRYTRDIGIAPNRLLLGVPFYGRGIADRSRTMTWENIVRQFHPAADVDEVDGLYFNGPETLRNKIRMAKNAGLGGIMIWEIGQDARGENSLLRLVCEAARLTR